MVSLFKLNFLPNIWITVYLEALFIFIGTMESGKFDFAPCKSELLKKIKIKIYLVINDHNVTFYI